MTAGCVSMRFTHCNTATYKTMNVTSRVIVIFSYTNRLPPYHHYHLCPWDSVLDISVVVNKELGKIFVTH